MDGKFEGNYVVYCSVDKWAEFFNGLLWERERERGREKRRAHNIKGTIKKMCIPFRFWFMWIKCAHRQHSQSINMKIHEKGKKTICHHAIA